MKQKPKFNKSKCRLCIYHSSQLGGFGNTVCSYATRNKDELTNLYRDSTGVHDRRGDDYNNCLLFSSGRPKSQRRSPI